MKLRPFLFVFLLFSKVVSAQISDSTLALKDVIITENRLQNKFSEVTNGLQIIDKHDIALTPSSQLNDVLNYSPGVDLRTRGFGGVQSDISINGGTFDQSLVLINGIRLYDAQTGHHSLNLPMTLQNIERIEILKGAAARAYGQNAFAGAINIVTKKHITTGGDFQAVVSDFNTYQFGGTLFSPQTEVGAQYQKSDGYRPNSDFEIANVFANQRFNLGERQLSVTGGFTSRSFGASGFYNSTNTSNEREYIRTGFISTELPIILQNLKLTPRFTFRANRDDYFFDYSTETTRIATENLTYTYAYNTEINGAWKNALGTTGFGIGLEKVNYENAKLLNHDRNTWNVNLEHRFSFVENKFSLTPNVLLLNYSDYGSYFTPGLDAGYVVSDNATVYANVNRVMRVPTFTDLYFSNKANLSNPNLQPELANNYEIGGKFFLKNVFFQVAIFRREGTNLIDRTKSADSLAWNPTNLNTFTINGVTANAVFEISSLAKTRVTLGFNYVFDYQFEKVQALSKYALDFLTGQYLLGIELPKFLALKNNFKVRLNKRLNQSEAYAVLDFKSTFEQKRFTIFAQVQNVTNTSYTEQSNIPMPGRWFGVGFSIK